MRHKLILKFALGVFVYSLCFSFFSPRLFAQLPPPVSNTITVSTSVDDTSVVFTGRSSPRSYIVFMQESTVIGTTLADDGGYFTKKVGALKPGINTISIYLTDYRQQQSSTIKYTINVSPHTDTFVNKVTLPPTIDIERHLIEHDERVRIGGMSVPDSTITLFLFDEKITKSIPVDSAGKWTIGIDATKLLPGKYLIYARTHTIDGQSSKASDKVVLEILPDPKLQESSKEEESTIEQNSFFESPAPPICELPKFLSPFDVDNTCRINKDEFIEIVKEWYHLWRDTPEKDCDIDNDNDCDLIDFSVLLYYVDR